MAYRKYLRRRQPMWWSTRSIEEDLQVMVRRYDVPRSPSLAGPAGGSPVVIRNAIGIATVNAVVRKIGLPKSNGTPCQKPKKWYADHKDKFVTARRDACVGCWTVPVVNRPRRGSEEPRMRVESHRCAECGKDHVHVWCALCHHWFHGDPKSLPAGEEALVAVPMGKRERDGTPVCVFVKNNCFHVWHARGREQARSEARVGFVPSVNNVRCEDEGSDLDGGAAGDGVGAEVGDSTGDGSDSAFTDACAGLSDSGGDGDAEDNDAMTPTSDGADESSDGAERG